MYSFFLFKAHLLALQMDQKYEKTDFYYLNYMNTLIS